MIRFYCFENLSLDIIFAKMCGSVTVRSEFIFLFFLLCIFVTKIKKCSHCELLFRGHTHKLHQVYQDTSIHLILLVCNFLKQRHIWIPQLYSFFSAKPFFPYFVHAAKNTTFFLPWRIFHTYIHKLWWQFNSKNGKGNVANEGLLVHSL